jgi:hypothetical protein
VAILSQNWAKVATFNKNIGGAKLAIFENFCGDFGQKLSGKTNVFCDCFDLICVFGRHGRNGSPGCLKMNL